MSIPRRVSRVLLLVASAALVVGDASAREPRSGAPRSGSTHQVVTHTGPGGNSRTWQRDSTWQSGAGRFDRQTALSGPQGGTRSRVVHAERTQLGHTRNTAVSDAQGRTASRSAEVVNDPEDGTRTRSVVWTGPNGGTATRISEVQKSSE